MSRHRKGKKRGDRAAEKSLCDRKWKTQWHNVTINQCNAYSLIAGRLRGHFGIFICDRFETMSITRLLSEVVGDYLCVVSKCEPTRRNSIWQAYCCRVFVDRIAYCCDSLADNLTNITLRFLFDYNKTIHKIIFLQSTNWEGSITLHNFPSHL